MEGGMTKSYDTQDKSIEFTKFAGQWESGSQLRRLLRTGFFRTAILPILVLILLVKVLMWTCLTYVGPAEFGIKVVIAQLRNDALQGAGSDRMVGLKMAEVYKGIEVLVLPSDGANGVNPLNLEQTLKLLEAKK
jgi:hypothetical protein